MEQVIRFRIDQNTLHKTMTADDLETIELAQEGEQVKSYRIMRMAARFMVDETGQPIPYQKALREFGKLTVEEYSETLKKFFDVMQETALPKATGAPSSSLSEAQPPSASLDGSQL